MILPDLMSACPPHSDTTLQRRCTRLPPGPAPWLSCYRRSLASYLASHPGWWTQARRASAYPYLEEVIIWQNEVLIKTYLILHYHFYHYCQVYTWLQYCLLVAFGLVFSFVLHCLASSLMWKSLFLLDVSLSSRSSYVLQTYVLWWMMVLESFVELKICELGGGMRTLKQKVVNKLHTTKQIIQTINQIILKQKENY